MQTPGTPDINYYKSHTIWFHFPRFGRNDRRHGVINPFAYMAIAQTISRNFVQMRSTAKRNSKFSASPLVFDWSGSRSILRPSVDLRDDFRIDLASRRERYVSADIRAFYHSIYTHAIPWAVHGKPFAKQNRGNNHYGNLLDLLSRNAQDGQTVGLPVGPDTSRIIAEVVASAIDAEIIKRTKLKPTDASRYVDDYTVGTTEEMGADALIATIRKSAAVFELELNHDKSAVISTSTALETGWKQAALALRPSGPMYSLQQFQRFFFEVGRLAKDLNQINVEKWSYQNARIAFLNCDAETWGKLQSQLMNAYRRNATLINFVVELLIARHQVHSDVDMASVQDFLLHRLPTLAIEDRTGELVWLLFLQIALEVKVKAKAFQAIFSTNDPMIAILTRIAKSRGLIIGNVDSTSWDDAFRENGLQGSMWLYAYEASRRGFANANMRLTVSNDSLFGRLLADNVVFVSIEEGLKTIQDAMPIRRIDNRHLALIRADHANDFEVEQWLVDDDLTELEDEIVDY